MIVGMMELKACRFWEDNYLSLSLSIEVEVLPELLPPLLDTVVDGTVDAKVVEVDAKAPTDVVVPDVGAAEEQS